MRMIMMVVMVVMISVTMEQYCCFHTDLAF
jgi:hypothetical protein